MEKINGMPQASSTRCALQPLWWAASDCLKLHGERTLQSQHFEHAENGQLCVARTAELKTDMGNAVVIWLPLHILHL